MNKTHRFPKKLIDWLASSGFEVVIARVSSVIEGTSAPAACSWDDRTGNVVVIDPRLREDRALSYLLHESGHIKCALEGREYLDGVDACPTQSKRGWPILKRSVAPTTHAYAVLKEEIDAWTEGEQLASELKIRLPNTHDITRAHAMSTYVQYVAYRLGMRPKSWIKRAAESAKSKRA